MSMSCTNSSCILPENALIMVRSPQSLQVARSSSHRLGWDNPSGRRRKPCTLVATWADALEAAGNFEATTVGWLLSVPRHDCITIWRVRERVGWEGEICTGNCRTNSPVHALGGCPARLYRVCGTKYNALSLIVVQHGGEQVYCRQSP